MSYSDSIVKPFLSRGFSSGSSFGRNRNSQTALKHHPTKDSMDQSSPASTVQLEKVNQEFRSILFTWSIENFRPEMIEESGNCIFSPEFEDYYRVNTKWRVELGRSPYAIDGISIKTCLLQCIGKCSISVMCGISLLDGDNKVTLGKKLRELKTLPSGSHVGWDYFISSQDLMENYLCRGSLKLFVTIHVLDFQFRFPGCTLKKDMKKLLTDKKHSDVRLFTGSQFLECHKAILSARSPVFAAMFGHDMEEKDKKEVEIVGLDFEVIKEMVSFIYTGEVKDMQDLALQLLEAADRYGLDQLKRMCQNHLIKDLSETNAAETLVYADRHSCSRLKAKIKKYIRGHFKDVLNTEGWKSLVNSNFNLMNEVLLFVADNIRT